MEREFLVCLQGGVNSLGAYLYGMQNENTLNVCKVEMFEMDFISGEQDPKQIYV